MRSRTSFFQSGMAHPRQAVEGLEEAAPLLPQRGELPASAGREAIVAAVAALAAAGSGEGSLGRLISRNDAYEKFIATLDKMNAVIDDLQQGKGTAGKFLKDPTLYNNANDTIANLKKVTDDINAGKGTLRQAEQG